MNINCLDYHLWDAIYADLMETPPQIYAPGGIKLELYSHSQEITIKMLQNPRSLTDLMKQLVKNLV